MDEELIKDLKKNNISFNTLSPIEQDLVINKIHKHAPFSGSKIAWESLKSSLNLGSETSEFSIFLLAEEISKVTSADLIFIGDSACDDAYSIGHEHLTQTLRIFSELPQHTYIVTEAIDWIACISFEGHLDFATLRTE
ncbi:hypothetical protein [Pseudomonas palleroniana]|uniref:hypothetical protein n=1 Tax=Pseudomonas palleroniana TaxID=191390 RepID=UPI0018E66660|nr:hypothetical protein [Pseudomonas palleroniana]MBI6909317.1 hypothetical protein [Pseudomonas palleroniana]